jgi:putative ABC transport system ATP-binding protein
MTAAEQSLIRMERLTKDYLMGDTVVQALRGITFDIPRGDYVAIMGHSGSGKSTLLNILGCLDTPTSGSYQIGGRNVSRFNDNELSQLRRERFGFVFQSFNLIPQLTVIENIEVPLFYKGVPEGEGRERALALAEMVGLGSRSGHRPTELSGGQRQRVAIARALANQPDVIFADEPTGNLDSRTGAEIMEIFRKLSDEGKTIVLITHESDIALHADRTIYLVDGEIRSDERKRK